MHFIYLSMGMVNIQ